MRTIAQISDLHFGTEIKEVCEALIKDLKGINPHLVIVSGDFTQRAREKQYREAADYIKKLPKPQMYIPGNHDIPLFDILRRIFSPYGRYKKYISEELNQYYADDEIAVLGINTTRPYVWKDGSISQEQIDLINEKFNKPNADICKILVTHHPFIPPPDKADEDLVDKAQLAMDIIGPCGIDLILAGHLHKSYTGDVKPLYKIDRSVIAAQAGTAISDRMRGEGNSYNIIQIGNGVLTIIVRVYDIKYRKFTDGKKIIYKKEGKDWIEVAEKDNLPEKNQP